MSALVSDTRVIGVPVFSTVERPTTSETDVMSASPATAGAALAAATGPIWALIVEVCRIAMTRIHATAQIGRMTRELCREGVMRFTTPGARLPARACHHG